MSGLAVRQAALVAALVGAGPDPAGIPGDRLRASREALLRKRAGDVARVWPELARSQGTRWQEVFGAWVLGRYPPGSLRDGWDLARALAADLPSAAVAELSAREALLHYDGASAPRPRRLPAIRLAGRAVIMQVGGRIVTWNRGIDRRV
jgi:hypothetical protein